jgi:hypothetical protein
MGCISSSNKNGPVNGQVTGGTASVNAGVADPANVSITINKSRLPPPVPVKKRKLFTASCVEIAYLVAEAIMLCKSSS